MEALHHVVVVAFVILYAYKVALLLANRPEMLTALRARAPWLDGVLGTAVLLTGGALALRYAGAWPWWLVVKIILVLALLPAALVALRRGEKTLAIGTLLVFGYVYAIGYTRSLDLRPHSRSESPTTPTDPRHGRFLTENASADSSQTGGLIGKMLYRQHCIVCHGLNGDKCLYGARNLQQSTLSLEARMALITNGRGKMPTFGARLTPEQIELVARHSQTLFRADSATVSERFKEQQGQP
jgi:cytochrome c5